MFISLLSGCTDVFESIAGIISEITAAKVKRERNPIFMKVCIVGRGSDIHHMTHDQPPLHSGL